MTLSQKIEQADGTALLVPIAGTNANRPAAASTLQGAHYYQTDGTAGWYLCDGSTWTNTFGGSSGPSLNVITSTASSTTLSSSNDIALIDATSGNRTVTLPDPSTIHKTLYIARADTFASHTVTLLPHASELFQPSGVSSLLVPYGGSVVVYTNTVDWFLGSATDTPLNVQLITSNTTLTAVTAKNAVLRIDATSNNVTVILPLATGFSTDAPISISRLDTSSHTVSVVPSGSDVINTSSSWPLVGHLPGLVLVPSGGAAWLVVGQSYGTQAANKLLAGPTTGADDFPAFRSIVPADLPLASSIAVGAVRVDGSTITASGGVISSVGGGVGGQSANLAMAYNYYTDAAGHYRIGYATSTDGRTWTRPLLEPALDVGTGWEVSTVKDPCLVKTPGDGRLFLYYRGNDSGVLCKIGLAISSNGGASFTKSASNPLISPSQSWEVSGSLTFPSVLYDVAETDSTKRWKMWYCAGPDNTHDGQYGIGYAYSADGITWTKYAGNPVLIPAGTGWEGSQIALGACVRLGSTFYLFYNATNASTGLWGCGLATFGDPQGTYTRSANNPLLVGDGLNTALTVNVAVADTTLTVTNAALFPIGSAVWVYNTSSGNHYLSYVIARPSSTTITLADAAPVTVASSSGHVASVANGSQYIKSAIYDGGWRFGLTAFQPVAGLTTLKEVATLGYADTSLGAVHLDYTAGLILRPTLAESQGTNVSYENAHLCPLVETSTRYGAGLAYQTLQVSGAAQNPRGVLDVEAGAGIGLTVTDDGANSRSKIVIARTTAYVPLVVSNTGGTAPIFVVNSNGQPLLVPITV